MMGLLTWCDGVLDGLDIPYGWLTKTRKRILGLKDLLYEAKKAGWQCSVDGLDLIPPTPEVLEALAERAESMIFRNGRGAS